ncbi:TetR/AcrR family transcriptional regulator [Agrococcus casei]|uniref:TetR/AcrR family transcriptional regulator n=1 Tax=Agrococcus casei TaxID=343512 RepID=UPI0013565310|nr:helix-turn-helix domain-containing protein [Agrococcus casei]
MKADTHSSVVQAATELFLRHGPDVTIRQIADRAGVSVGTVMGVADKDGLIVRVLDTVIADLPMPAPSVSPDATTAVMQQLTPFVEWFSNHVDLARAYLAVLVSGRQSSQVFESLAQRLISSIAAVLGDEPEAKVTAHLIHRAYLGELMIWAGSGDTSPTPTLENLRRSVRTSIGSSTLT